MKLVSFLVVTALSISVFAGPRPTGGGRKGRPETSRAGDAVRVQDQVREFNKLGNTIPGLRIAMEVPKGWQPAEYADLSARLTRVEDAVKKEEVNLMADSTKAEAISKLFSQYNVALSTRSKYEDAGAKDLVELIDAGTKFIEAKVTDNPDFPVSADLIGKVFEALGSTSKAKLNEQDVQDVVDKIKAILGNEFTIRQIIDCIL